MRIAMITAMFVTVLSMAVAAEPGGLSTRPCRDCDGKGVQVKDCSDCARRWQEAKRATNERLKEDFRTRRITSQELRTQVEATPRPDASSCMICRGNGKDFEVCVSCYGKGFAVLDARGHPSKELTKAAPDNEQALRIQKELQLRDAEAKVARLEIELALAKAHVAAVLASLGKGQTSSPQATQSGSADSGLPLVTPNDKPKMKIEDSKGNKWELVPEKP